MKKNKLLQITLLLASMLTMLSNAIIAPALPAITEAFQGINDVEFLTKLLMTLPALTIAIVAPIAGKIVDNYGRIKVLKVSLLIYIIAGTSGFWLNSLPAILVGRFFLGFGVAGIMTAATTLIGDYFGGKMREKFMSLQGSFVAFGGFLFISTAGYLTDINWQFPFLIYSFGFIVLILVPIALYEPKVAHLTEADKNNGKKVPRKVWFVFISAFTSIMFFYIVPIQIPYFLQSFSGISNKQTGLVIGFFTLAQAMSALFYKNLKQRMPFESIYSLSFIIMAIGFLFVGLSHNYVQVAGSILVLGVGSGWLFPNANLWIMALVPAQMRGKYIGFLSTFIFLGMFVSPIAIHPIQNMVGINYSFLVSAGALATLSIVYFIVSEKQTSI